MDATERREQILTCAMRLFEKHPYSEVSTSDIATEAGIARPLIHHYFGTKHELYLEVVRRLSYVPAAAISSIPEGTLEERIDASIERWLTVAKRHRNMWLSTITMEGSGRDHAISQILQQADEIAADRILEALDLTGTGPDQLRLHAMVRAYGGMAKVASRLWLVDQTLSREEVHALLTQTLRSIVEEVAPKFL
jgi:AcrR family transcriptional regulator